jgi:hypothetical protein
MGEMRNAYKILVRNPEGKRTLGRNRRRRECNIGMDIRETVLERVKCIHLAQDREQWLELVNMVRNLRVP